jgi:hypothetical protein
VSRLANFRQDPDERIQYTLDYSQWLGDGETVSSMSFSVEVISPTGAVPIVMDGYSIDGGGKKVFFFVKGGDDQSQHKLHALMESSAGQVKEDAILYKIVAK